MPDLILSCSSADYPNLKFYSMGGDTLFKVCSPCYKQNVEHIPVLSPSL